MYESPLRKHSRQKKDELLPPYADSSTHPKPSKSLSTTILPPIDANKLSRLPSPVEEYHAFLEGRRNQPAPPKLVPRVDYRKEASLLSKVIIESTPDTRSPIDQWYEDRLQKKSKNQQSYQKLPHQFQLS